jgi:hypothetical protein
MASWFRLLGFAELESYIIKSKNTKGFNLDSLLQNPVSLAVDINSSEVKTSSKDLSRGNITLSHTPLYYSEKERTQIF